MILFAKIVASVFLLSMVFYLLPPIVTTIFESRPPGIVKVAYTVLTVYGIIMGFLIVNSDALLSFINRLLIAIYQPEARDPHLTVMLGSTILALSFVVGGLVRSYFNLHNIEESKSSGNYLGITIGSYERWVKRLEYTLRVTMFFFIMQIEYVLTGLRRRYVQGAQGHYFALTKFEASFDKLWHWLIGFYLILLAWDFLIALNRSPSDEDANKIVKKIIVRQAVPVHLAGLLISALMCSIHHHSSLADTVSIGAAAFALSGISLLVYSLFRDRSAIMRSLTTVRMSLADFWKEMCEARKLICGAFERKYMRLIAKLSGIFLLFVVMGCRGERIGKEPSEIAVGVLEHGSAIPIIVAEKEGIFRRHNLKVKIFKVSPSEHMPSLLRGDYSVLSASSFPVIFSAAQQNPGRIQCYMTGGESSEGDVLYGIVIPRGSNALSLRDLVGKKIGSASKFTSINLRNVLASKFGEVNPVTKIQELSDRSLLLDGLDKGTFEAAVMDQPALSQAIGRGYKVIERNFRAKYLIDPYWSGAGVVDRAWAISHRNSFEAYLDSLDEALRMCKQEPDRVKKEFLNFFNVGDIQPDSIGMYVYPAARFSPPRAFVADLTKLLLDNKLLAGPVAEDIFYKK